MRVRWTPEAVRFLEAQEDYLPGLGVRILEETEKKLRQFAGIHVRVPVMLEGRRVRYVYRMFLSRSLPYKVYYDLCGGEAVVVAVRHARQRPIERG